MDTLCEVGTYVQVNFGAILLKPLCQVGRVLIAARIFLANRDEAAQSVGSTSLKELQEGLFYVGQKK